MSMTSRIQRRLDEARAVKAPRPTPPGWPPTLACPRCKREFRTSDFYFTARPADLVEALNPVCVCPDYACGNIFSPNAVYLQRSGAEGGLHGTAD